MTLTPGLRKFVLSVHLVFSVGWIGAVLAYLALVLAAMTFQDALVLRAAWIGMGLTGWYVIVPLALASLLTGLVMALGTKWGLFRHYWVLISLVLTIFATIILLSHMQDVSVLADAASRAENAFAAGPPIRTNPDVPHAAKEAHLQAQLVAGLSGELLHAGIGLLVLLVIQVLNVYKPQGMTPYGWRKQEEERRRRQQQRPAPQQ